MQSVAQWRGANMAIATDVFPFIHAPPPEPARQGNTV